MSPAASAITVRIDELVLEGFPPGERYRIAAAVERELGRLLAGGELPAGLLGRESAPVIDAGEISVPRGARPEATGARIAGAIYRGLAGAGSELR